MPKERKTKQRRYPRCPKPHGEYCIDCGDDSDGWLRCESCHEAAGGDGPTMCEVFESMGDRS